VLVTIKVAFGEQSLLRLLNWLADENRRILQAHPDLPGLYESGVYYEREKRETWCDYLMMLAQGHEDCDGLSAARAGELMARGAAALQPGDGGYREAKALGLTSIRAECIMTTRVKPGESGLYHCVTAYKVGANVYRDDPSARLGMLDGRRRRKNRSRR